VADPGEHTGVTVVLAVLVIVLVAVLMTLVMGVARLARMIIHRPDFPRGTCHGRVALVDYVPTGVDDRRRGPKEDRRR